ncbi:site-specific integrase [Myxococcota bacterium]|nr:site-specific integrase [Myxococcota bacterium]
MQENVTPYQVPKSGETRFRVDLAFTDDKGLFHRYRKQGFRSAKDAASWARKTELVIRTGGTIEARRKASSGPDDPRGWSVDQLFEKLVPYWEAGRLKPNTRRTLISVYKNGLRHLIGKKKWATLSQHDLDVIAGGHWRVAVGFAALWKWARKMGAVMPDARWNPPKRPTSQRLVWLEPDEARRALELLPVEHRPLFLFALGSGMRISELLGLRWGDIDLRRRLIHVERQRSQCGDVTTPKSGKSRIIPLSSTAQQGLDMLSPGLPGSYVFPGCHAVFGAALRALQPALGKQLTPHVLRHTFASWSVQAGTQLVTVARVLGHGTTATTEIYAHLMPAHLQDGVSAVDAAFSKN